MWRSLNYIFCIQIICFVSPPETPFGLDALSQARVLVREGMSYGIVGRGRMRPINRR